MKNRAIAGLTLVALIAAATLTLWTWHGRPAQAHCQVPCGIYDDSARIARMKEDATTIEKAMRQISELAGKSDALALNQATRWVTTKEDHASNIIEVVSTYFLAQKVKPVAQGAEGYDAYLAKLADHHAVIVAAMKTKQAVDSAKVDDLVKAIEQLAKHY